MNHALNSVTLSGLYAEFGVYKGLSINWLANTIPDKKLLIHGFDSFEGLQDDWFGHYRPMGSYNLRGRLPNVGSNVVLHKGWFTETLPEFLKQYEEKFSFIHLDADTYKTTKQVLDLIATRLARGTIIVFDEYHNFPNWKNCEYRAWQELVAEKDIVYEYLGFGRRQASVRVLSVSDT